MKKIICPECKKETQFPALSCSVCCTAFSESLLQTGRHPSNSSVKVSQTNTKLPWLEVLYLKDRYKAGSNIAFKLRLHNVAGNIERITMTTSGYLKNQGTQQTPFLAKDQHTFEADYDSTIPDQGGVMNMKMDFILHCDHERSRLYGSFRIEADPVGQDSKIKISNDQGLTFVTGLDQDANLEYENKNGILDIEHREQQAPQKSRNRVDLIAIDDSLNERLIDPFTGMEFILIQPGHFLMGCPETEIGYDADQFQHPVTISRAFYLGKCAVTQKQWGTVMDDNPAYFKGENRPVEQVSWETIQVFIERINQKSGLSFRLPTEAEWEYAARAGTQSAFSFGPSIDTQLVNYNGECPYLHTKKQTYRRQTVEVGSLPGNQWGLYEMHGNVWEWVADRYQADYYRNSPELDPPGPSLGDIRVLRGGSWYLGAEGARSASRTSSLVSKKRNSYGFRLAFSCEQLLVMNKPQMT